MNSLRQHVRKPEIPSHTLAGSHGRTGTVRGAYSGNELDDRERLFLLAEFGGILIGSLDYETSATRIADVLVPAFADCCILRIKASAAAPSVSVVRCVPKHQLAVKQLISDRPADPFSLSTDAPLASGIARPLNARGRRVGDITLARLGKRAPYHLTRELSFAENMIDQLALAVDSARLYQEAQRAIQVREELLAIVSHDLRNPLSVIAGTVTTMLRSSPSEVPARQRSQIERVARAAGIMDELIHLLLDQVSIQTGRLALELSSVEVGTLLSDAAEMFQSKATERQIQFEVRCDVDAKLTVTVDRRRIVQVLSNLLGNAMKFTPAGGRVILACALVDHDVTFTVTDTGCGVPEHHLSRIFERHWHASRENNGGTGLGLFISRGIVEAHGGVLSATSVVGRGTSMAFVLPHTPSSH